MAEAIIFFLFHRLKAHHPALTASTAAKAPPTPAPTAAPVGKLFPPPPTPAGLVLPAAVEVGAVIVLMTVVSASPAARTMLK